MNTLLLAVSLSLAPTSDPQWTRYTPANTGLTGDVVVALHVDGNDEPWIGSHIPFWEQGGLAHWDGSHWTTLTNVEHPAEIASPRFYDIVEEPGGALWIATEDGLLYYDPAQGPASLARYDETNTPVPAMDVVDLAYDPAGVLWLAVDDNETGIGGLARFQPSIGAWDFWDTTNGLPWGSQWPGWDSVNFVGVIPEAEGARVWFGSSPMGMATYKDGAFSWFGLPNYTSPTLQPVAFFGHDPVDAQGNAWIVTNKGLARRAVDGTYTITGYPAGLSTEVSVVSAVDGGRALLGTHYGDVFEHDGGWTYLGKWNNGSATYTLKEDSTGAVWAGGIGGTAKLSQGSWQRYRLTNTGMVGYFMSTIAFGAAGEVYMNGNASAGIGGFSIFDGVDWVCANDANYGLGPVWGLPSDDVEVLCTRANGKLVLAPGGGQGALEWDGTDYQYLVPAGWSIVELEEDSLGRLWAAEDYGNGVQLVDGSGTTRFTWTNSPLPQGDVDYIFADRTRPGFVWIVASSGFALTNGADWTVYPRSVLGLTQNSIGHFPTCGAQGADGTLWIGSGQGLFHFDPTTSDYTQYTPQATGMPSDEVWHVEIAPDGSVWAATFDSTWPYPGGLTHFDGTTWTTYSQGSSPLPHNQLECLVSRPVPGGYELWVGTASEGVSVLTVTTGSAPTAYCTAGTSASGCVAQVSASGTPSATAPTGFTLSSTGVEGQKDGLFFFGTNGRQANAWGNGTSFQCVAPPVQRAGLLAGSGTAGACDGAFAQDLNTRWTAKPAQNPGAGAVVQAQLWYRDPFNTSNQTTSLSDAIEFLVAP